MHQPVLLATVVSELKVEPGNWYIDATFGRGGHTWGILDKKGRVLAFDFDQEAINYGQKQFQSAIEKKQLILIRENFNQLAAQVAKLKRSKTVDEINGIVFDFGTSSEQLTSRDRGFSFESENELDMRMDDRLGVKAKDLLAVLSEKQLTELFRNYGGEKNARKIAKAIIANRKTGIMVETGQQLAGIVSSVSGKTNRKTRLHPATKVFQALRIAVNHELTNIEQALPQALEILNQGAIITIAFHEGEDRIAKQFFKQAQQNGLGIAKPLITPSAEEINQNPRARSAKMRVFEV